LRTDTCASMWRRERGSNPQGVLPLAPLGGR